MKKEQGEKVSLTIEENEQADQGVYQTGTAYKCASG